MNSLSYSGIERDIMIFENASDRIDTSINLNTLIYNQSLRDAETRVFSENGTYDDLESLYIEATKTNKKVQKGIFIRIAEWFEKFFRTVMDKVTTFLTGSARRNQNELVDYDPSLDDVNKDAKGILGKLKEVTNAIGKVAFGGLLWKFILFATPIFVRVYAGRKIVKLARKSADMKISDVKGTWGKLQSGISDFCKAWLGDEVPEDKGDNSNLSFFGKLKKWIGGMGKMIMRFVAGALKTVALGNYEGDVIDKGDVKKAPKEDGNKDNSSGGEETKPAETKDVPKTTTPKEDTK
jgi:hypothetical protein